MPMMPFYPASSASPPGVRPSGPAAPGAEGPDEFAPTEEELAQLAELGITPDELYENRRRMAMAEEAASMAPPEGRKVGSTYVAANPLEHLAAAGGRIGALLRRKKLMGEREGILGRQRAGYGARFGVGYKAYGYPKPFTFGDE